MDMGQYPHAPPSRRNWYPLTDDWFAQTPQIVPQAFSNITHPGYKALPPATVSQKDLCRLEFMTWDNLAITNLLSTFATASESTLNNLRSAMDNRERLFDQIKTATDVQTQTQLFQQLHQITPDDSAQMQFMLDISPSVATAYQHLIPNLITTLTQIVLTRRDAYLVHANNSLDNFPKKNLWANSVLGSLMQEYEQHLIGMGVKTGPSSRYHPYGGKTQKKKAWGRGKGNNQATFYSTPAPQYQVVQQPFFQPQRVGFHRNRRGRGSHRGRDRGQAQPQQKQQ